MTTTTFRDLLREASPPWLRAYWGERLLYAIGVHVDLIADGVIYAVKARFPGLYSTDGLEYTGRDRVMARGRLEGDVGYAERLRGWLDDHPSRGGPYALLRQIHAVYADAPIAADLVYASGRRWSMDVDGVISVRDDIDWDPDADTARWARWWLFLHWPLPGSSDGDWGDGGTWGDSGTWGTSLTVAEVADLRMVPSEWGAAHAMGRIVLLHGDAELWGYPDGDWGDGGTWSSVDPVDIAVGG